MSFSLRRSRYRVGRFRAGADPDDASGDAGDEPPGDGPTVAREQTAFARMTDADLRAVAGRAVDVNAFSDGLPIRMSLD